MADTNKTQDALEILRNHDGSPLNNSVAGDMSAEELAAAFEADMAQAEAEFVAAQARREAGTPEPGDEYWLKNIRDTDGQ
jgi:hypothetical protein